ncbi:MAG: pantetheine-phosphate adenylyltransferase, partial [Gemmatimonadetes bacterium]|nr:pantetheine-phosphate adenylyltransferase [Gemmatimonadota bacterium]
MTLGHEDIVRRTLRFCDRLVIAVARSPTHQKKALFSVDERLEIISEVFGDTPQVECVT